MDNIFMEGGKSGKKRKKIAAARLASILATRWTGTEFIYGQPNVARFTPLTLCLPLC